MKILLVNNYHYRKGGSETVYFETGKLIEDSGHEIRFFSVNDPEVATKKNAHLVNKIDYFDGNLLSKIKKVLYFIYSKQISNELDNYIKNEKPDIAHLHIFYGRLTSSILPIFKKYKIPVIMTVHEYRILCPSYTFIDGKGKICHKCLNRNYLHCILNKCNKCNIYYSFISAIECFFRDIFVPYDKYISRFIFVSKFSADLHVKHRQSLVNKTTQIYNFVDLNEYVPRTDHEGYCLYLGRLSGEKGIITMLEAWKNLIDVPLKIVGTGPLLQTYREYSNQFGMNHVDFLGFLSGDVLKKVISGASFVIVPSEWYENNPMAIVEAFALGKPVIAADIGGIPELVINDRTGFLFTSRDSKNLELTVTKTLGLSREEYMQMSINCRLFAQETFDKNSYKTKLFKEYQNLLNGVIV